MLVEECARTADVVALGAPPRLLLEVRHVATTAATANANPNPSRRRTDTDLADYFKAALGWKPSQRPFHTSANRECGNRHAIKPGSEFDVPVTPGRPDLNLCRKCGYVAAHSMIF